MCSKTRSASSWLAPDEGWRRRPDMDPQFTRPFRASIVARARFIEDLVVEQAGRGRRASTSSSAPASTRFAQRRPEIASRLQGLRDRPAGPAGLEAPAPDRARLRHPGLAAARAGRLRGGRRPGGTARGGRLRCRPAGGRGLHRRQHVSHQGGERGHAAPGRGARPGLDARHDVPAAAGAGGPGGASRARAGGEGRASKRDAFHQLLHAGGDAGTGPRSRFREARHVSAAALAQRYFAGRTDGLRPPNNAEELLVATT